ncbi:hypothetical protein [Mucilaginibacter sp. UYCu711]|uniref:hypothetical protein n=1 Tax=Mucilaginibacter sp. UYCu711 TaxID=3156339 RepID=UPI003D1B7E07
MQEQYNQNQTRWQEFAVKASLLMLGVAVLDSLLNEPHDTVNYILFYKGKKMYHGISYEDCFDGRIDQYERAGIIPFDDFVYDYPKTRAKAMELECRRINRDQTPHNNHHR